MTVAINQIERYYDTYEVEGEEMGQSDVHIRTIRYLALVLQWLFRNQIVYVGSEINLYHTADPQELPLCPDIVVIKGFAPPESRGEDLPSYHIGVDGPAPALAIEVASPKTWKADLEDKPARYAEFGVQEYFACDPNSKAVWTGKWRNARRLLGWELNQHNQLEALQVNAKGQLWSEQTQSNLVVENRSLHLYDLDGKLRLTQAEKLAEFLRTHGFDPDNLV